MNGAINRKSVNDGGESEIECNIKFKQGPPYFIVYWQGAVEAMCLWSAGAFIPGVIKQIVIKRRINYGITILYH